MKFNREIDNRWSFKSANTKEYTHCYHTYPAMMIPQVARELINNYAPEDGQLNLIFDPYMGSGTTLVEAMIIQWFDFDNAHNLDKFLMGGKRKEAFIETLSIENELNLIKVEDNKRYLDVISFLSDYKNSINNVASVIRRGGRVCYVVGNRTVKGIQIPLDYFTAEMFCNCGFKHINTIVREIPNKRMSSKNSPSNVVGCKTSTMTNEFIVILEKL